MGCPTTCVLLSSASPQGCFCAPSSSSHATTGITLSSFCARPGPLREKAFSTFSRSPFWAAQNKFPFLCLLLTTVYLNAFPRSPSFLALALNFYPFFYLCLVPPKRLYGHGQYLFLFPPRPFQNFPTTLSHVIPPRRFVSFSHTVPSAIAGNLILGMFLTSYGHSTFSRLGIVLSEYIPGDDLGTYSSSLSILVFFWVLSSVQLFLQMFYERVPFKYFPCIL